jgi:D-alanyl-D-alanine carboxypeptidase (penicillin-binding protein 5/6)
MNARARWARRTPTLSTAPGFRHGQYNSARDVMRMSAELIRHEIYFQYSTVWLDDLDHGDGRVTQLTNTNRLIRLYDGCDGLKTGSTQEALYCMSATAKRGDMRVVAVVLGARSGKSRFDIASRMLDHGFANYRSLSRGAEGRESARRASGDGG